MGGKIVRAAYPGLALSRPGEWRAPYVFASPHSGREYPTRFVRESVLDLAALRRSEDAYVDQLLPDPNLYGVPVLAARFPRAFVDVNRDSRELDPQMFTASAAEGGEIRSSRVAAGFGVIPRLAAEGRSIYAKKLTPADARARLRSCYVPYHEALEALLGECRERFGFAVLIDWHSMPSASGHGHALADVVIGDRFGASADRGLVDIWDRAFRDVGLTTALNTPYAGGHVTSQYGRPRDGVHVLQIELNRALYLDEGRVARHMQRFESLREKLNAAVALAIESFGFQQAMAAE